MSREYPGTSRNDPDAISKIDYFLRDLNAALGRIQNGQVPSGAGTSLAGVTSHHALLDLLTYDDHGQYVIGGSGTAFQGRTAGQTIYGGSTTNPNLAGVALSLQSLVGAATTDHSIVTLDRDLLGLRSHSMTFDYLDGTTGATFTLSANRVTAAWNGTISLSANSAGQPAIGIDNSGGSININPLFDVVGASGQVSALARIRFAGGTPSANMLEFYKSGAVLGSPTSYVDNNGAWNGPSSGGGSAAGWTDDGTVVRLTTASDQVALGTASPTAGVSLTSRYSGSGGVNTSWQDASGNPIFEVRDTGVVALNNAIALAAYDSTRTNRRSLISLDSADIVNIGSASTPSIYLNPSGTTRLRLRGDANIGLNLGDSSAPGAMLDVRGIATGRVVHIDRAVASQTADIYQTFDASAAQQFTVDPSGFVNVSKLTLADGTDNTKKIKFTASGNTTAKTLTLASAVTVDRTINYPDNAGTFVTRGATNTGFTTSTVWVGTNGNSGTVLTLRRGGTTMPVTNNLLLIQDSSAGNPLLFGVNAGGDMSCVGGAFVGGLYLTDAVNGAVIGIATYNTGGHSDVTQAYLGDMGTSFGGSTPGGTFVVSELGLGVPGSNASSVNLVNQTASIATTTLFTPDIKGTYRVSVYLCETTGGAAGTVTATIGWTDDGSAKTVTSTALALTGAGQQTLVQFLEAAAGTAITYATTVAGVVGTPKYSIYVRTEWIGN